MQGVMAALPIRNKVNRYMMQHFQWSTSAQLRKEWH